MAGRNSQISRIYAILDILDGAPQGLSVAELCDRVNERAHQVGKRTVYRDLQALNAAGFPLFERGQNEVNGTRWALEKTTRITEYLALSTRELIALFLAQAALTPLRDTPFYDDLTKAFQKIEEKLGAKHREFFQKLAGEFRFEAGPKWGLGVNPDVVETLRAACAEKQVASFTYNSSNSGKNLRRVGPHYLYFGRGSLYLVGEDLGDQTVKIFSVPRITEAELVDEAYGKDTSDPSEFFASSFGMFRGGQATSVRLRVGPPLAAYLRERQWHGSQRVISLANGAIELTLDVAITPDLVQWVLGFGAKVEVLEPAELRTQVADEAQAVVTHYQSKLPAAS